MTAMTYHFGNMKVKRSLALYRERYDDIKKQNMVPCQYEKFTRNKKKEKKKKPNSHVHRRLPNHGAYINKQQNIK